MAPKGDGPRPQGVNISSKKLQPSGGHQRKLFGAMLHVQVSVRSVPYTGWNVHGIQNWCTSCNGHISPWCDRVRTSRDPTNDPWLAGSQRREHPSKETRPWHHVFKQREKEKGRVHGAEHLGRSKHGQILTAMLPRMSVGAPLRISVAPLAAMPRLPRAGRLRRLVRLVREIFLISIILHVLVFLRTCRPKRPVRHDSHTRVASIRTTAAVVVVGILAW